MKNGIRYKNAVAYSIDKEARHIIDECYKEAERLLRENSETLNLIAHTLMEKETIEAQEFAELIKGSGLYKPGPEDSPKE